MEEVRDFCKAITKQISSSNNEPSTSGSNIVSNTSEPSVYNERKRNPPPSALPSSFLKKKKRPAKPEQSWDKDMVCLPKEYSVNNSEISIPRGV